MKMLISQAVMSLFLLMSLTINAHAETITPSQTKVLGLELNTVNRTDVRKQLWDIGGFMQAKHTLKQINIDIFYTWSRMRDSYYLTFRYNQAGDVTSVERHYRPYSDDHDNDFRMLDTKRVALKLAQTYGAPQVIRKGWGGFGTYPSYLWQDENVKIEVDRKGSESLGDVFVRYTLLNKDPYRVVETNNNDDILGRR